MIWCREGGSNPHDHKGRQILSLLRLPIPPSRPRVGLLPKYRIAFHLSATCRAARTAGENPPQPVSRLLSWRGPAEGVRSTEWFPHLHFGSQATPVRE